MNKERTVCLIFLLAGIYGFIFSIQLPTGKWYETGPGAFPLVLSFLLCVSGILWFILGKAKEKEKATVDWGGIARKLLAPAEIMLVTAGFILGLDRVGYLLVSWLYMFLLFFWVSRFGLRVAVGLATVIGVGSWYLFAKLLGVQLP